ncbi:MAG: ABC transporter permease [Acidobacteriia bacterium]|nr:ABC transporter permease [Terriglobia bacterium]
MLTSALQVFLQDLRYSLRQLRRTPGFAAVAILTLALGIGANTAVFSAMNAVLLRFQPVPDPQQLVYLHTDDLPRHASQTGEWTSSFTEYSFEQLRTRHDAFSDLMAFVPLGIPKVAVRYGSDPEEAQGDMVSGNFFSGLGVTMARGRGFTVDDEKQHSQVAVLSDGYWTRRFGRNPSVLGQTLYVKGVAFTIVGVTGESFTGVEMTPTDFWVPLQNRPDITAWGQSTQDGASLYGAPTWWALMMIGRLKNGVTEKQAVAQLNPAFQQIAYNGIGERDPNEKAPNLYFSPARGIGSRSEQLQRPFAMLMAMVGLVLLIACGNVAMLLLARNTMRDREFSLRMSLGAGRGRLFRQLLTESLILVVAGAALGWGFALWIVRALASWSTLEVSFAPDTRVLLFTLLISALAAVVFGLAPLRKATSLGAGMALKTSASASSQDSGKSRTARLVVAMQMALALVLLVAAALLVRTMHNLENADLGIRTSGLLVFGVTPPQSAKSNAEVVQFYQRLTERMRALPGVDSLTLMQNRIGSGWANNTTAYIDGAKPASETTSMRWNAIGPDYFHVLGASLVLGRDFTDADSASAPKVAIINQTFAQKYLPRGNPLGHIVSPNEGPHALRFTIVGVAADTKYTGVRESSRPMAYFPYTQVPGIATMHFELRTRNTPLAVLPDAQRAVHEFGPDLPLLQPTTQQQQFRESFTAERLFAQLSVFFGVLAAVLVATGLFGTLAYRVNRRTAEIGVRMALGAQRGQVLWMVLRESLVLCAIGAAVGLPVAFTGARLLRSILFGVGPADAWSFTAAIAGIALVALVASWVPARRASSVDPIVALRYE